MEGIGCGINVAPDLELRERRRRMLENSLKGTAKQTRLPI
jgi:hypothetical protein